jgi:hypothetical protein
VLETIVRNVGVADAEENLVCQDTGIAVYTCRVGEEFPLHPTRIYEALKVGTERATLEHPLRSNAVPAVRSLCGRADGRARAAPPSWREVRNEEDYEVPLARRTMDLSTSRSSSAAARCWTWIDCKFQIIKRLIARQISCRTSSVRAWDQQPIRRVEFRFDHVDPRVRTAETPSLPPRP